MTAVRTKTTRSQARALQENSHNRRIRRIGGYHSGYRHALLATTADQPEIEDLADSFPGLLFALASVYGTARARAKTRAMIQAGEPLRKAAAALGLPWWLRKLPPQAFNQSLGRLPSGPENDLRLAQLAPTSGALSTAWLSRVSYATEACHEDYALWVAKQFRFAAPAASNEMFIYLTAWAWHANQPETQGYRILRRPWSPSMGLKRAIEEMSAWRRRINMVACLGTGLEDTWLKDGAVRSYEFVALRTVEDFIAESVAMDNCLDQYADHLETGMTRVFSIRRNGKPVGDVEIGPHEEESRMPAIVQLRGPRNRRAAPDMWRAVYSWIGNEPLRQLPTDRSRQRPAAKRREARKRFWHPYLAGLKGTGHAERFKLLALGGAKQTASARAATAEAIFDERTTRALPRRGRAANERDLRLALVAMPGRRSQ